MAVPSEGARMVARMRKVVVFPAPLAPRSPKISPGRHWKLTWSTARTSPRFLSRNVFTRHCASIMRAHFEIVRTLWVECEDCELPFMAVGALLGVKIFGCHAEHVVTLYANTVKSRLSRRRSFLLWSMRLWLGRFRAHSGILAQRCAIRNPGRAL